MGNSENSRRGASNESKNRIYSLDWPPSVDYAVARMVAHSRFNLAFGVIIDTNPSAIPTLTHSDPTSRKKMSASHIRTSSCSTGIPETRKRIHQTLVDSNLYTNFGQNDSAIPPFRRINRSIAYRERTQILVKHTQPERQISQTSVVPIVQ